MINAFRPAVSVARTRFAVPSAYRGLATVRSAPPKDETKP